MKVILRSDIGKLGKKHDVVDVSDGYGRNFLIPRGLAEIATPEKEAAVEQKRAEREAQEQEHHAQLKEALAQLTEQGVEITAPANEQGHLFAGLHAADIAQQLTEQVNVEVPAVAIQFDDAIKEVGEHQIPVRVGDETIAVPVTVTGETQ